jgi:hypothetical protein
MLYFKFDYNSNSNSLNELTFKEFLVLLTSFNREQFLFEKDNKDYCEINNIEVLLDLYKKYNVIHIIHQDSESDIYVCEDIIK